MRAALPTDLLLRLMNATPEQYAAVERVLGLASVTLDPIKGDHGPQTMDHGPRTTGQLATKEGRPSGPSLPDETNEADDEAGDAAGMKLEVARQAFALLQKLEMDAPPKAPSVLMVFRLYCVDGHSADRVARKCRCSKGTVMSRLRHIERVTGKQAEEFRAVSGHLQSIDDEFRKSGAREIYRRGMAE